MTLNPNYQNLCTPKQQKPLLVSVNCYAFDQKPNLSVRREDQFLIQRIKLGV